MGSVVLNAADGQISALRMYFIDFGSWLRYVQIVFVDGLISCRCSCLPLCFIV